MTSNEADRHNRRQAEPNPWSRGLKWLARTFFAAAVLALAAGLWLRRPPTAPAAAPAGREKPVTIDWSREPFQDWESSEDGIRLRYPARFDPQRGFGRFTSRDLEGGIEESDVVAFRSMAPRSVIMVATYKASRRLSWQEWVQRTKTKADGRIRAPNAGYPLGGRVPSGWPNAQGPIAKAQPPTPFAAEFGGSDQTYRLTRAGDRQALAVSARGAVRYPLRGNETMELWRFESLLVAEGDTAIRITAGVHQDHYSAAQAGLQRTLDSFRWTASRSGTGPTAAGDRK